MCQSSSNAQSLSVLHCQMARLDGGNILQHWMSSSRLGTLDINQTALCFPVRVWMPKCQKSQPVSLKWEELLFGEPRAGSVFYPGGNLVLLCLDWVVAVLSLCPLSRQRLQECQLVHLNDWFFWLMSQIWFSVSVCWTFWEQNNQVKQDERKHLY